MRLVLASASPRRAALLRSAGFAFEVIETGIDERMRPDERPSVYVRRLAHEKSEAAFARVGGQAADPAIETRKSPADVLVVGADTAVVIDDEVLGKPHDVEEARSMLRRLSGRRHEVLTGLSLRASGGEIGTVERTGVRFADLSDAEISWYAATKEGQDKAGGYAVQGLASRFVLEIDGSYSNVVGLPLAALCELLCARLPLLASQ